jgi:hypothetical protein
MKSVFGLVAFCSMVGVAVCGISSVMWLAGFGVPNCEPNYAGYAEFYATLFVCSFSACFGAWAMVSFACVANKFLTKKGI